MTRPTMDEDAGLLARLLPYDVIAVTLLFSWINPTHEPLPWFVLLAGGWAALTLGRRWMQRRA